MVGVKQIYERVLSVTDRYEAMRGSMREYQLL